MSASNLKKRLMLPGFALKMMSSFVLTAIG